MMKQKRNRQQNPIPQTSEMEHFYMHQYFNNTTSTNQLHHRYNLPVLPPFEVVNNIEARFSILEQRISQLEQTLSRFTVR